MKAVPIAELILLTIKRSKLLSKVDMRAMIGIGENVLDHNFRDSEGQRYTHNAGSVSITVEALIDGFWVNIYRRDYQIDDEHTKDQLMRVMLSDLIIEGLVDLKKEYKLKINGQ